jgi:hypothetical protein
MWRELSKNNMINPITLGRRDFEWGGGSASIDPIGRFFCFMAIYAEREDDQIV